MNSRIYTFITKTVDGAKTLPNDSDYGRFVRNLINEIGIGSYEEDCKLLDIYHEAWYECGSYPNKPKEKTREDFNSDLEYRAWLIGWNDYIVGDEVSSIDLQTPDEIIKNIRFGNER